MLVLIRFAETVNKHLGLHNVVLRQLTYGWLATQDND